MELLSVHDFDQSLMGGEGDEDLNELEEGNLLLFVMLLVFQGAG